MMNEYWRNLLQNINDAIYSYKDYQIIEEGYDKLYYYKLPRMYAHVIRLLNDENVNDDMAYSKCYQARKLFESLNGLTVIDYDGNNVKLDFNNILEEMEDIDIVYLER